MVREEVGVIELREPELSGLDQLPYPVALTTGHLADAVRSGGDPLKALFALKDCFEATIKYLGILLLMGYFSSRACTPERSEALLERMVRPSLGDWVSTVVRDLSDWLIDTGGSLGRQVAGFFVRLPQGRSAKPQPTDLWKRCSQFVEYRNDALGHGATRRDAVYRDDMERWLPPLKQLLDAMATLQPLRLVLVNDRDRCQVWMGPEPTTATEPGEFRLEQIGHFMLRGHVAGERPEVGPDIRDLYPFICYVPDAKRQHRLHYYDSIYRYQETRKEVRVLEYDEGSRQVTPEPVAGLEARFTRELLSKAFGRHRSRMEVIEGRVANFGELLTAHADIVGRRFAIEYVKRFIEEHDRGLLLIEAEPGKGKTALLCHLIENEFGHFSPPPVYFFYRRTAGITDPEVCVKSLYAALLEAHGIEESEGSQRQDSPEAMYHKLVNLLSQSIAPRLAPSRPQLIFIDALDEAEATPSGATAYQRIPENLPAGVYVIATARPVRDRAFLARRSNLECYDLDGPDLLQENLRDGMEFAERELVASELSTATLGEIARVGRGNFLVLKHLCGHVRTRLNPDEVSTFLGRLATAPASDQLGFIYEEFWSRMTQRATLDEQQCLGDVAGLLAVARTAIPAELICHALDLRAGAWDLVLRRLIEYLTVTHYDEEQASETVYRIYHESFAEFLRFKLTTDRDRYERLLAEYCLRWAELPAGYARLYALRFGAVHLLAAGKWDAVEALLNDLDFLEAKTEAGLVFELAGDFAAAVRLLPEDRPRRHTLKLLNEALRRDIHFIHRHASDYPQGLFQCLWNTCWWYDCEEAAEHYVEPDWGWNSQNAPWTQPADQKLCRVMEHWCDHKVRACPGLHWVRSHRPPTVQLGRAQRAVFCGHESPVKCVTYSPDGRRIVSGSGDGTIHVWDAESGAELSILHGHEGAVTSVTYSPDGQRIASADCQVTRLWDAETAAELAVLRGYACVAFSPDGRWLAGTSEDGLIGFWDGEVDSEVLVLPEGKAAVIAFSPDGSEIAGGSAKGSIRTWSLWSADKVAGFRACQGGITSIAYSPDGRRIAIGTTEGVCLWRGERGIGVDYLSFWQDHRAGRETHVNGVAYRPDGQRIASGSEDGAIREWDAETGALLAVLRGHSDSVRSIAYSPGGRRIVSGSEDGTVRVWDTEGAAEATVLRGDEGSITSVAYSPDGQRIAVANSWSLQHYTARVFGVESGTEVAVLSAYGDAVRSIQYSADGRRIFGNSDEGRVHVWDAHTYKRLEVVQGGGDVKPVAPGVSATLPLRAIARGHETVIERVEDGKPVAWFPIALAHIVTHPSGPTWAGAAANHLYLITFEGIAKPASQETTP